VKITSNGVGWALVWWGGLPEGGKNSKNKPRSKKKTVNSWGGVPGSVILPSSEPKNKKKTRKATRPRKNNTHARIFYNGGRKTVKT